MDMVNILPYIDIQHDALAVFDDVEQGVVVKEDVWVSVYKLGSTSVHGKMTVQAEEGGGGIDVQAQDGIQCERVTKTNFVVSAPSLDVPNTPVHFPRQVLKPPYTKATAVSPEQHINTLAYSSKSGQLAIGGPDGYCVVTSPSDPQHVVELKGHVGDVLHIQWFPSGQVVLTASSDLTVRIFSATTGINPRTLKGHTRAITATDIVGVGRQVITASKDGSVRLWDVGAASEVKKWSVGGKFVDGMVVVKDAAGCAALGVDGADAHVILAASPDGSVAAFDAASDSGAAPLFTAASPVASNLVSIAYSPATGVVATGHANGVIALRRLDALRAAPDAEAIESVPPVLVQRNESPIYSMTFVDAEAGARGADLLVGTGAGLPCRLLVEVDGAAVAASVKEEYAGWESVGIETWAVAPDSVWCAGGDSAVRRY